MTKMIHLLLLYTTITIQNLPPPLVTHPHTRPSTVFCREGYKIECYMEITILIMDSKCPKMPPIKKITLYSHI